jgi:hypothetical protein
MPTIPFKETIKLDIRDSVPKTGNLSSHRRRRLDHQTILGVGVTVEKTQYLDLKAKAAAAFAVD